MYPSTWAEAWTTVDIATANVTEISDDFWASVDDAYASGGFSSVDENEIFSFERSLQAIVVTMAKFLFQTFGVGVNEELREMTPQDDSGSDTFSGEFQSENFNEIWERYELIVSFPSSLRHLERMLLTC